VVVVGLGQETERATKRYDKTLYTVLFGAQRSRSEATDHTDGELERFEVIGLPWSLKSVSLASPSSGSMEICLRA
jgi:hypothetical protein